MEIISTGQTGLNALLLVVKLFEHAQLDTLAIFLIIKKLNLVIFLTAVILSHGLIGVHVLLHVSPVFKNVLTDGLAIIKLMSLKDGPVMPVQVFTLTGPPGTLALKLVLAVLK